MSLGFKRLRAKICTYGKCKNCRNTMGSHSVLHGCIKSCMLIKSLLYKKPYYLLLLVGRHVSVPYWTVLRSLRAKICTYGTCTTIYFQYNSYQRTSYNTTLQYYLSALPSLATTVTRVKRTTKV